MDPNTTTRRETTHSALEDRWPRPRPTEPHGRLAQLSDLGDHTTPGDRPDIRGWEVKTAASLGDRMIGRVEDLVVDLDAMKVRYLLVSLDKDAVATSRDRRILVPIGVGRLAANADHVRLDSFTGAQLVGIPEFRSGKLTRNYEAMLRRRFASPPTGSGPLGPRSSDDFYDHEHFDDRGFWGDAGRGTPRPSRARPE
jgi:photosynthetic reaction center H subunit